MAEPHIEPHKVTKPIQLVAAWLAGLVLIDAMFLGAAASITNGSWPHGALIVAAILNVPLFLVAIFLLQTKFRAELQEDSFYSEYLSKRTSQIIRIDKNSEQDSRIEALELKLAQLAHAPSLLVDALPSGQPMDSDWSEWLVSVNSLHPQVDEITKALADAGIPIENFFGGKKGAELPTRWIISINFHIPIQLQIELLRVLVEFQFVGFNRWEPRRDAMENEDVYVGSYGTDQVATITPKLKQIIADPNPTVAFEAYCRVHGATEIL